MAIPGWDTLKNYWGVGSDMLSDEERKLEILRQAGLPDNWGEQHPEAMNLMVKGKAGISLDQRQKLFQMAAKGGAKDGGPAISGGGTTGVSYADPYPGDPSDRFPKAPTEEEEKYRLALRGPVPGMMTYRGWT